MWRTFLQIVAAALLGWSVQVGEGHAQDKPADTVSSVAQVVARLSKCFKPPQLPPDHPGLEIGFLVTFNRTGDILGKPRITYESEYASDNDRLLYRTALAEALERCTPLPFTESLGNAVAGRPLRVKFDNRRTKST